MKQSNRIHSAIIHLCKEGHLLEGQFHGQTINALVGRGVIERDYLTADEPWRYVLTPAAQEVATAMAEYLFWNYEENS